MVANNRIIFLTSNNNDKYIPRNIRCRVAVATRKAEGNKNETVKRIRSKVTKKWLKLSIFDEKIKL